MNDVRCLYRPGHERAPRTNVVPNGPNHHALAARETLGQFLDANLMRPLHFDDSQNEARLYGLRNWRLSWWEHWAKLAEAILPRRYHWLIVPNTMTRGLAINQAIGVRGADADHLAHELRGHINIPWTAAIAVHRTKVIPKWVELTESALPNTSELSADREMRAIKADMASKEFSDIPKQIRNMKRLWPSLKGLRVRRDLEAQLFQDGLAEGEA